MKGKLQEVIPLRPCYIYIENQFHTPCTHSNVKSTAKINLDTHLNHIQQFKTNSTKI